MNRIFFLICALFLTLTGNALAEIKIKVVTDDSSDTAGSEAEDIMVPMESGKYLDVGTTVGYQRKVWSPDQVESGYSLDVSFLTANFGWCGRKFCHGPTAGLGTMWSGVTDASSFRSNHNKDSRFMGSVGYKMFEYLTPHFTFNQHLSMPLVAGGGPGAKLDLGFAVLPHSFFAGKHGYFGFDFGVSVSYLQTGVAAADTNDVNWLAVGGYVGITYEAWGKYKLGYSE